MKYLHRTFFFFVPLLLDDPLERDPGREECALENLPDDRELCRDELVRLDPRDFAYAEAFASLRLERLLPLLDELFLLDPRLPGAPLRC